MASGLDFRQTLDEFGAHFRDADTGQEMNISYRSARVALADYPSTLCSVGRVDISPKIAAESILVNFGHAFARHDMVLSASCRNFLRTENGRQYRLPFNYEEVIRGEHIEQNIWVTPDDTIVVPN